MNQTPENEQTGAFKGGDEESVTPKEASENEGEPKDPKKNKREKKYHLKMKLQDSILKQSNKGESALLRSGGSPSSSKKRTRGLGKKTL